METQPTSGVRPSIAPLLLVGAIGERRILDRHLEAEQGDLRVRSPHRSSCRVNS